MDNYNGKIELDASEVDSAVLKRLIEEVKEETKNGVNNYNRLHNRHNRTIYPRPWRPPKPEKPPEPEKLPEPEPKPQKPDNETKT